MNIINKLRNRIKVSSEQTEEKSVEYTKKDNIHIQIDEDTGFYKNEKQQIIAGAKHLLEVGICIDMVDAIITAATTLRGLKFQKVKKNEEGETVVVLKDPAQNQKNEGR